MKKILIMVGVGVALFSGTVFGLLAVQGRLDHEGTRGIPVVSSLFPPPPKTEEELAKEAAEGHGDHADAEHGDEHGDGEHGGEEHKEFGPLDGPSKVKPAEDSGGGHGGGHAAPAGETDHGPMPVVVADTDGRGPSYRISRPEELVSKERYFPGAYFTFKRQESAMSASDLDALRKYIEREEGLLESKEHALAVREDAFASSGKKVASRYNSISRELTRIETAQIQLNTDIEAFNLRSQNLQEQGRAAALKVYSQDWRSWLRVLAKRRGTLSSPCGKRVRSRSR